eukprot:Skav221606  [mRNA]  locus=scaffold1698:858670:863079:+ [translate_table: standard]
MVQPSVSPEAPLFGPDWNTVRPGSTVSLVLHQMIWDDHTGVGRTSPGGKLVRVAGDIPVEAEHFTSVTLLQVHVESLQPMIVCSVDGNSKLLLHQPVHAEHLTHVVELCAGASLTSVGLSHVGFQHSCSVEKQPNLAMLHASLHPKVPVINASVLDEQVVRDIWRHVDHPCVIVVGFACQPYSRGGSQSGGSDERAESLPASLKTAHLLQAPIIVLENVMPARTSAHVRQHLDALQWELGYHVVDCGLKLEDMWSANRYRWWVIASHPCIGPIHLPVPHGKSTMVVHDVMPFIPRWPAAEEDQLLLSEHEEERFRLAGKPLRHYQVKSDTKLPTALHSWGGQTRGCACECRLSGFSEELLRSRGIYAQLVALPPSDDGRVRYRHLHVKEVSILSGVPVNLPWSDNQRLNLCAIGQMAAPMHSLWVGACIRRHLDHLFGHVDLFDPEQALSEFKAMLWNQAKEMFPMVAPSAAPAPQESEYIDMLLTTSASREVVRVPVGATIAQLTQAEQAIRLQDQPMFQVVDPVTRQPILATACVSEHPEVLLLELPMQESSSPDVVGEGEHDDSTDHHMDPVETDVRPPAPDATPLVSPTMPFQVDAVPSSQDMQLNPLLRMNGSQLTNLLPPDVCSAQLCEALRHQKMPGSQRKFMLHNQGYAWGDDELWAFMQAKGDPFKAAGVVMVDPLLATGWANHGSVEQIQEFFNQFTGITKVLTAVWANGHWRPYSWTPAHDQLLVRSWDHTLVDINPLNHLHGKVCSALGLQSVQVTCERRQFGSELCGAAAIAFVEHHLASIPLPTDENALRHYHDQLRAVFADRCNDLQCTKPWCWGFGNDVAQTLATLLQFHGVPQQQSAARSKLVLQSLGKDEVARVLAGVSPWQSLKALANQHKPVVQLVMPDELQQVVNAKQNRDKTKNKNKRGPPQRSAPMQSDLDPSKLELVDHAFCVGDDEPIQQIPSSQVSPLASGVALMTMSEAKPFLQSNQLLTQKGLAVLILNAPDDMPCSLLNKKVRFAAKCTYNQEPMLLTGMLVQLGGAVVYQFQPKTNAKLSVETVACARFTVFRDQWPGDWDLMLGKPVKAIIDQVEPLQLCTQSPCDCTRAHADPMNDTEVVRDVFRRQYYSDNGRPCKPAQASHFSVFIRFAKQQELAVLHCSGVQGLYVEPRSESGMEPSVDYQIVWLPQSQFADAQHNLRCEPQGIGLARTGSRYGVRVMSKHFESVYQSMKPDGLFLKPGARLHFHCGPWPFGVDRKQLARVLKDMSWHARPLQPAKTVEGGIMWAIQATDPPPQTVVNLPHGQVVITRADQADGPQVATKDVIGQSATVQLCSQTTPNGTDPWLTKDPWQTYVKPAPIQPQQPDKLQDLEQRIEKSILSKLPAERMEVDTQETRLQSLEQQMQHMAGRQVQLEKVVTEHHAQHSAQVQSLQGQMSAQMEVQRAQMAELFKEQMGHIATLLQNKSRRTGPGAGTE